MDASVLDSRAWEAICRWPALAGREFVVDGLDFGQLSRCFLWDKVGRALRRELDPAGASFEAALPRQAPPPHSWPRGGILESMGRLFPFRRVPAAGPGGKPPPFREGAEPLIYVPVLSDRLRCTVAALAAKNQCRIMTPSGAAQAGVETFLPPAPLAGDRKLTQDLHEAILAGLGAAGVTLGSGDVDQLHSQLAGMTSQVRRVEQELDLLRPDLLLVHGDNHPPFQAYVLAARKRGIPSFMVQHGLDCEHHYLNEAYASAIAVWGSERQRRYRTRSLWQPKTLVTGNPEFDHLRPPGEIDASGNYWLWLTRPHTSEKCYAPSRNPREGLQVLAALIEVLRSTSGARLVVKAHPYDYVDLYRREIAAAGMEERITLSGQGVRELIPGAALVITEDSTAGMEAMFWGKPLVHAHFAPSVPTMPFVDFGAALPGFDSAQVVVSLERATRLNAGDKEDLLAGQRAFLNEFAGPCDGQAGRRVVDFITEILGSRAGAAGKGVRI